MSELASPPRLEVFVARHCWGCDRAQQLAREAAARFPALCVEVIDLEDEPSRRPPALVAVPTYFLDGQVISLGNPKPDRLLAILASRLGSHR